MSNTFNYKDLENISEKAKGRHFYIQTYGCPKVRI